MSRRLFLDFDNGSFMEIISSEAKGFVANLYKNKELRETLVGDAFVYEIGEKVMLFDNSILFYKSKHRVVSTFTLL